MREWIEHHKLMGATRFYLCDHLSADGGGIDLLRPYVDAGIVSLLRCEREFVSDFEREIHLPFFDAVLRAAVGEVEWVACLDSDEFLSPVRPDDADIVSVLRRHADAPAVYVNWVVYGTSGVRKVPPNRLISETLVRRAADGDRVNTFVKAIVRPDRYIGADNPHTFRLARGLGRLTDGTPVAPGTLPDHAAVDQLRINHYKTGDADYFERIKAPFYARYATPGPIRDEVLSRASRMAYCDVEDRSADRFVPSLRERVLGPRVCLIVVCMTDGDGDGGGAGSRHWGKWIRNLCAAGVAHDTYVVASCDRDVRDLVAVVTK